MSDPFSSPVWPLWRAIRKHFPVLGLLWSFGTPGSWGSVGVDHLGGLRRNHSTKAVFDLLAGRPQNELEALLGLADLNVRRQKQILATMVVAYVTIPVTVLATWAEVSSDTVMNVLREQGETAATLLGVGAVGVLYYFASHWRARQLLEVLELVKIERLAAPPPAPVPPKPKRATK